MVPLFFCAGELDTPESIIFFGRDEPGQRAFLSKGAARLQGRNLIAQKLVHAAEGNLDPLDRELEIGGETDLASAFFIPLSVELPLAIRRPLLLIEMQYHPPL
jgi:hypothetical protein